MTSIPNIGKPAATALSNIGITELEQLSNVDEGNLLKLHGVGPKAADIIKKALREQNLSFKEAEVLPYSPEFAVFGSLGCNNSPNREIIRDFLIGSFKGNNKVFEDLCSKDFKTDFFIPETRISSLEILTILTHGKEGAAETAAVTADGRKYRAAYFIIFESHKKDAKIKSITAYTK